MKFIFFLLTTFSLSAQIKGVVKDSITGKPISYVNIWVENKNISSTSEEDGTFEINLNQNTHNLIFSALGYEKKIIKASKATNVLMQPKTFQLDEVVVFKKKQSKQIIIGQNENTIAQAFDNQPKMDVKFFPYLSSYKKTRFIKNAIVYTDSRIENATIKLHLYTVDANGLPGDEILKKDLIVTVKKGTIKNKIDLTDFNLVMPKNGIFVGFEKLFIEKNKVEKELKNQNSNTLTIQKIYYPFLLYNYVEMKNIFSYSGGKWIIKNNETTFDNKIQKGNEPAINLTLTN